jgi:hypothetical protein
MSRFVTTIRTLVAVAAIAWPLSAFAQYSAFDDPPSGGAGANVGGGEFGPSLGLEIKGGDFAQGQSSQVIVMMRNYASVPITLGTIDLVPSSNVTANIVGNQCVSEPIKPGLECAVTVAVKGESNGAYRVGMLINHSGRTRVTNAAIIGIISSTTTGAQLGPPNEIESFPVALNFDKTSGRTPLVRSIVLRNGSSKKLDIGGIELIASPLTGFAVSAPECKALESGQSCVVTVTWAPSVEGKSEGVLLLRHNGPSGSLQIPLSGEFTRTPTSMADRFPSPVPGQGLLVSDADKIDFGSAIDGAASISVTLINMGDSDLKLNQVRLAGSDNGLSLANDDCFVGKVLPRNEGCVLTINWLPRRKGPVIDDIQIIHDGARGVLVLPVRGTATEVVNLNMPMLGGGMSKLDGDELDEGLLGSKSSAAGGIALGTDVSGLNGYRVTSLSAQRAVISGPRGRVVVLDGQPAPISGSHWIPRVLPEGVELIGAKNSVFLMFDRSLGVIAPASGLGVAPTSAPPQ